MILFCLLLSVSLTSVYCVGRSSSEGDTGLSREVLHRQAEQQRDSIRQLVKLRDELKYSENVHEMVPVRSDFSFEKDPVYGGSYQELTTISPHFSQRNSSLPFNNTEDDNPSGRQRQIKSDKSLILGSRPSGKDSNKEDAGHPNDEKYANHETERNGQLTIKTGSYKISLRPNHYEAQSLQVTNLGQGNVVPFRERVTQERETYFAATPMIADHGDSHPAAAARLIFDHGDSHRAAAAAARPIADHGAYSTDPPVVDHGESSFQHSVIIEQVNYVPLLDQGSRDDFEATTNGNSVSELGNSADCTPLGSSLQIRGDGRHTKFDLLSSFKAYEAKRDVIINGYPVKKVQGKADVSTSEQLLPVSLPESPGNPSSNQNSESKIEARDEYPPLLTEEVNFSDCVEAPGQLVLPKKSETEIIGRKFTAQPTQVLHATDSETIPTTETVLQILNIPEGFGDTQQNDHHHDVRASDFLNIDSNDELIVGRRGGSVPDQAPSLSEEGSGEDSVEERIGASSTSKGFPRISDLSASQQDTSTPCTTPESEPSYCRDEHQRVLPENPVIRQIHKTDDNTTVEDSVDFSQSNKTCGVATRARILGGSVSNPHEWAWMVALLKENRFFCGGVLLNNWYVLTAAHCTLGLWTRDFKVRLGEYNFLEYRKHKKDIGVQVIKRHARFTTLTSQHDIALLKLKRPAEFSRFVSNICLPQVDKVYRGVNATAVGWGAVFSGGAPSPVLRHVTLQVWSNEDCDRTYVSEDINDSFLCAGSLEPDQDACRGDSGGPLMARNDNGRWEVIGIVSWGRQCGDPNHPGVYTRVTTYLDWIRKNMT